MSYINDHNKSSTRVVLMWLCGCVFYLYQYMLKVSVCIMQADITSELNISAGHFAWCSGFFYLAYALMQIFAGNILDRFGPRKPLSLACLMCALGGFIFAFSNMSYVLMMARFLIGLGAAYGFLSCAKIAVLWFNKKHLAFMLGITMVFGTLGGMLAGQPLEIMVIAYGWRATMMALSFFGLLLSVLCYVTLIRTPENWLKENLAQLTIFSQIKETLVLSYSILCNRNVILILMFGFFSYVPISGFGEMWSNKYALNMIAKNQIYSLGGHFVSVYFLGISFGSILFPFLLWGLKSYRKTIVLCALATASCYVVTLFDLRLSKNELVALFLFMGLFNAGQVLSFAYIANTVSKKNSGLVTGLLNSCIMMSGFVAQPLLGYAMKDNMISCDNSLVNFNPVFIVIIWCLVLSGLCAAFLKEVYDKQS